MTRITISLQDPEKTALSALAEKEFRDPRAQAALIIRKELERLGLLQPSNPAPGAEAASGDLSRIPHLQT